MELVPKTERIIEMDLATAGLPYFIMGLALFYLITKIVENFRRIKIWGYYLISETMSRTSAYCRINQSLYKRKSENTSNLQKDEDKQKILYQYDRISAFVDVLSDYMGETCEALRELSDRMTTEIKSPKEED